MIEKTLENLKKYKDILTAKININASANPINALHHINEAIATIEDMQKNETDTCTWVKDSWSWFTECNERTETTHIDDFEYCPFCSKKIIIK